MREISEITWKSFAPAYGQAHPVVQKGIDHYLPPAPAGAALWSHAWRCEGDISHFCLAPITSLSQGLKELKQTKGFFLLFSYEDEKSMVQLGSYSLNFSFVKTTANVPSIPVPPLTYI